MEIVSRMKRTVGSKPKNEARQKLGFYLVSQIFTQLINFQQLVRSMGEFIGHGKMFRSDILLDAVGLALESMIQSLMYDRYDFEAQRTRIQDELENLNIFAQEIKIKSLYPRTIKLDLVVNSPPKDLTILSLEALLESVLNEPLRVVVESRKSRQTRIKVYSSNLFKLNHSVSYVGKDGSKISGDSYLCENFANGQTLLAISDGMGNGEIAHKESSEALKIIKCLLSFNVAPKKAIQTLQELKQNSNADERFFSLDLCMIDRERSRATFYKKGATPTFLVRNDQIEMINLSQLPVGVINDQPIDHFTVSLEENDVLVMCSDGIFEQYPDMADLQRLILEHAGQSPKLMTKSILQATVNKHRGKIKDDMLVLAVEYLRTEVVQHKIA
ncbi:MAG: SpoIIE family protein phosphatase [Turicibacter sp.]|nr:SpoIIE family protein phosphatase [Turicibacter sp.]